MRNIICIGASSGGLEAIQRVVRGLPADLPAAVFIVRHIAPEGEGLLAPILQPYSALPVADATDGEAITNGRIYIAPPNRHLVLERKTVSLITGPKENWVRPAIDPLFRTAAQYHGPRAIGVILSGKLDDGTAGLWAIKRRGGFAVVQQPDDASSPEMPQHALAAVEVDVVADAEEIGALMSTWCRERSAYSVSQLASEKTIEAENRYLMHRNVDALPLEKVGVSAGIICPDCGGQFWRMKEGPLRFRCHVGHGTSAHTLLAQQGESVEEAGWSLIRAVEEDITLSQIVLETNVPTEVAQKLKDRLRRNRHLLTQLRRLVVSNPAQSAEQPTLGHGDNDVRAVGGNHVDPTPVPRT